MANARLGKELTAKTRNKIGMLAEVTSAIAAAGVNIHAISAYAAGGEAYFRISTDDNKRAQSVLKTKGYEVSENEVVLVDLENKPGIARDMAAKLKDANIDLSYIYGTTCGKGPALIVLSSDNNTKAIELLK